MDLNSFFHHSTRLSSIDRTAKKKAAGRLRGQFKQNLCPVKNKRNQLKSQPVAPEKARNAYQLWLAPFGKR